MILLISVFAFLVSAAQVNSNGYVEVITRDVCIIGGGSTGTFSAIQLYRARKSFVVVEQENILGGTTNTYKDPKTNETLNYGVVRYSNLPVVIDYFNYLRIPWTVYFTGSLITFFDKFFDFDARRIVNNFSFTNPASGLEPYLAEPSVQAYVAQLSKYPELVEGFYMRDPIPVDLLLPFGEFIVKYNISDAAYSIFNYAQGLGDILRLQTLYVFKSYSLNKFVKDNVDGFIVPQSQDLSELYNNAYKILKNNIMFQSRPIQVVRSAYGVEVTIDTPKGRMLIKAKKLLVTIAPKVANLRGFDLRADETNLFNQFTNTGYYTGLVRNSGLPTNAYVMNVNPKNLYGIPTFPGLYSVKAKGGLFQVLYCSPQAMSVTDEYVKADILASLATLQEKGVANKTREKPEFASFAGHVPFQLTVSTSAIKAGFYKKLYALQGQHHTYWTGGAFHTYNSGLLWKFTNDVVLPGLIQAL